MRENKKTRSFKMGKSNPKNVFKRDKRAVFKS